MARESAYIKTRPSEIKFSVFYPDGSEKFSLVLNQKQTDVLFIQENDRIMVDVNDLDKLIRILEDLKEITSLPNKPDSLTS